MRRAIVGAAVCLLSACGSGDEMCVEADGTYLVEYDKLSGTCPDIPDRISTTRVGSMAPPGCTIAKDEISPDNCRADFDYTCTLASGEVDRLVGYVESTDANADHAEGKFTYYATLGSQGCVGTYTWKFTRQ